MEFIYLVIAVLVQCSNREALKTVEKIVDEDKVEHWANTFGRRMLTLSKNLTAYDVVRANYSKYSYLEKVEGRRVVKKMATEIKELLQHKFDAVQNLVEIAEELHSNHSFDEALDIDYLNNKKILSETEVYEMEDSSNPEVEEMAIKFRSISLEPSLQFNAIPINHNVSTVHVPTNVFDRSPSIMNGVHWSDGLDRTYMVNNQTDSTLTWQYFCSSDGFFRVFPGMKWPRNNKDGAVDLFDCRLRSWYLQAATCPKNLVILVDASGSMKGLRQEIARSTVAQILETLGDDDYFNILRFSNEIEYLDPCFNGSMMPATSQNKRRLQDAMTGDNQAKKTADFELAFQEAFHLLDREYVKRNNVTLCNKAILLVTDWVPDKYESVFDKYNWQRNKTVRVFTYLIGREISDDEDIRWMACANKGFYSHISTLADIKEKVQHYVTVMSRPMAIERFHQAIWSSVYLDYMSSLDMEKGLKFMTSVAMPVFDLRNKTFREGNLLGVVGTDVPVEEFIKIAPSYKLGVNGYAFMINHNGYVLFHPDFTPYEQIPDSQDVTLHPDYNNMDLMDVILPTNRKKLEEVRENMLSGVSGSKTLEVLVHYDSMKRMTKRNYHFFYEKIGGTDFSLGLALPATSLVQVKIAKISRTMSVSLDGDLIQVAPWQYCPELSPELTGRARIEEVMRLIKRKSCNIQLQNHLLHDCQLTDDLMKEWIKMGNTMMKRPSKKMGYIEFYKRHGIEIVFIGTKGGLSKYNQVVANLTDTEFMKNSVNTIEADYYKRAVEGIEDMDNRPGYDFTFSIPVEQEFNYSATMVTASAPIAVFRDGDQGVAAVVGLQMKYHNFAQMFLDDASTCVKPPCDETCANDTLNCYLLDNHGYIMASNGNPEKHVGQFFGTVEENIMAEMLSKHGIFEGYTFTNYQAICPIKKSDKTTSSANFVLNPLKAILNGIIWVFMEMILFLTEFSITSWWSSFNQAAAQQSCDLDYDEINMDPVERRALDFWRQLCQSESPENQIIGHRACNKNYTLYRANLKLLASSSRGGGLSGDSMGGCQKCVDWTRDCEEYDGQQMCEDICLRYAPGCLRTYVVSWVRATNLLLVVADAECQCMDGVTLDVQQTEMNQAEVCAKLQDTKYRDTRASCIDYSPVETVEKCGQSCISLSLLLTIATQLVSRLVPADL